MATAESQIQPTLIFIPDISGFTNFVNATEISHSQHIISELLQKLVSANSIGLQVSAFEGDAILFYRNGEAPMAAELLTQIQQMYLEFHAHLKMYEAYRICHCGACCSAANLTVKFVAHYGDVSHSTVLDRNALHGSSVIAAHRLLKNDVPGNEYALMTSSLMEEFGTWVQAQHIAWCKPVDATSTYDVGEVRYCWLDLEPLRARVPDPVVEDFALPGLRTAAVSLHDTLDAPLELAFNVVSDMNIRHEWLDGLNGGEELNGRLTRTGSEHQCIIKGTDKDPRLVAHGFEATENVVAFTESNHRDGYDTVWVLTRQGGSTQVDVTFYTRKGPLRDLVAKLVFRPVLRRIITRSLKTLNELLRDMQEKGEEPPLRIVLEPWAQTEPATG